MKQEEEIHELQIAFEDDASREANHIGYPIVITIGCKDIPQSITMIKE